ncbi:MAG: cation:proton antiporter [Myxococcales bacterium]
MPVLVATVLGVLLLAGLLHRMRLSVVSGYLLAGLLLGPSGLGIVSDQALLTRLGAIGVLLLLFFAGMEVSLPTLVARWRVAIVGTLLQVVLSLAATFALGEALGWSLPRIVLLGFVISLSSTSIVLKLLADYGESESRVGQNALGILLVQDIAVIGMVIVLGLISGEPISASGLLLQAVGGLALIGLVAWVWYANEIRIPLAKLAHGDEELQVFTALIYCLGLALVTGLLGLSAPLGAFVAGLLVRASRDSQWVHERLGPFRVVFVAVFFVSVGSAVNTDLLLERWSTVALLVAATLLTNMLINALILRALGSSWRESLYGGALLSQIGEFSFVLAAVGLSGHIIERRTYDLTILVIFTTLLVSPLWIQPFRRFFGTRSDADLGMPVSGHES